MNFLNITYIYLILPIAVLMVVAVVYSGYHRKSVLRKLLGENHDNLKYLHIAYWKRHLRLYLMFFSILFLLIVAARPWWGVNISESVGGKDIIVVFDTSRSMLAADVAPSRIEHAKSLVREILANNPEDRFGLIAFAGEAYLTTPLTADSISFNQELDDIDTESMPIGGTNIEAALLKVESAFKAAGSNTQCIILITDGEELVGDASKLLKSLKDNNIKLLVVGIGSSQIGSVIQVKNQNGESSFLRDNQNNLIKTKLNDALLKEIAEESGGKYFHTTALNSQANAIQNEINKFNDDVLNSTQNTPIERFMPFLTIAFLAFLGFLMISEHKKVLTIVFAFFTLLLVSADEETIDNILPYEAYSKGRDLHLINDIDNAEKYYVHSYNQSLNNADLQVYNAHNLGVVEHLRARNSLNQGENALQQSQLEQAKMSVKECEEQLKKSQNFYHEAISVKSNQPPSTNSTYRQLLLDKKRLEELKKAIQEQEQQQQQQENNQQNENKDQDNQDQNNDDNNSQEQQDNSQSNDSNNSEKNNQDEEQSQENNQDNEQENSAKQEEQQENKNDANNQTEQQSSIDEAQADRLLDLLSQDEEKFREQLKMQQRNQRRQVEKDW